MKNKSKNFSIKIIKGIAYIYSWEYKKKRYRSNDASKRYHWKYRGRYGTKKANNFVRQLGHEEQEILKLQVGEKLKIYETKQKKINELLEKEPYKTRYNEILNIKNRIVREDRLTVFKRELNYIVTSKNNLNR